MKQTATKLERDGEGWGEELRCYDDTLVPPGLDLSLDEWRRVLDTLYPDYKCEELWILLCCFLLPTVPVFPCLFMWLFNDERVLMRARDKLNKRVLGPKGIQLGFVGSGQNPVASFDTKKKGGGGFPYPR